MFKVKIVEDFSRAVAEIFVYCDTPQGRETMNRDGVFVPTKMGSRFEPALALPVEAREELLNALLESGVKPREQSRVEGMLEATKAHLEDMRRLVFEPTIVEHRTEERK